MLCPPMGMFRDSAQAYMHMQSLITDVVLNKQLMNVDVPKEYD